MVSGPIQLPGDSKGQVPETLLPLEHSGQVDERGLRPAGGGDPVLACRVTRHPDRLSPSHP
jgi:hypothetical protein